MRPRPHGGLDWRCRPGHAAARGTYPAAQPAAAASRSSERHLGPNGGGYLETASPLLVVGAVWLFDGASTCRADAPQLYYAALLAWLLLVALNPPWLVLLRLPLLLLCRAPLFFRIVERMSGKDGAPMERRNYVSNERKPQLGLAWTGNI